MPSSAYRLPTAVRPRRYGIALDARLDAPQFTGQVTIQLEVPAPVADIELHARDLTPRLLINKRICWCACAAR